MLGCSDQAALAKLSGKRLKEKQKIKAFVVKLYPPLHEAPVNTARMPEPLKHQPYA